MVKKSKDLKKGFGIYYLESFYRPEAGVGWYAAYS
jgi:hypothetical protein